MIENVLAQGSFWMVNKSVARKYGMDAAILLSELITKRQYVEDQMEDEYFYETREEIEENTTLSSYKQREAIKILEEAFFIDTLQKGIPAQTYYRVFDDKVLNFLTTWCEKISHHTIIKENIKNKENFSGTPLNTPEAVEEKLTIGGSSSLDERAKVKEVLRSKKKHSWIPVAGSPRNYQPYQKKERTIADGRGIV
jgi:hypothetical protein